MILDQNDIAGASRQALIEHIEASGTASPIRTIGLTGLEYAAGVVSAFEGVSRKRDELSNKLSVADARIAYLESTQQPRPMADAKPVRQLAEWFTAGGMSLGWDTTIWVGRVDMTRGRWSTEGICRPPQSAPRHFLPLPAQSSETCENCGSSDCEPQASAKDGHNES